MGNLRPFRRRLGDGHPGRPLMPRNRAPGRRDEDDPCSFCGGTRWHTLVKGAMWLCRNCGATREPEMAL